MPEEAKAPKITQATAKSVGEWVGAYYGDDAIDMSKATKVKHLVATAQFASVVYVVSKNTKLAHTDLSDTTYTAIDTMYAKAAEIIIKLLHRKYRDGGRRLTAKDFEECGGKDLFGKRPNYAAICNDYIKEDGMVDSASKVLPVYETNEGTATCYGRIVDDMDAVKRDHTYLLSITSSGGKSSGALSREQIFNIYDSTTDNAVKIWKKLKDIKSGGDFELEKMMEEALLLKHNLVKQTGKMALVLGGATYALGAMAGGLVFVPALFALGSYALGKRWLPDWLKAAGASFGGFEKRYQKKREIQRSMAHMDWLVRYVESGGKPKKNRTLKQIFNDLRFVGPANVSTLKKQGKTLGFAEIEGLDRGDIALGREAAGELSALINYNEKTVAPDTEDALNKAIDAIEPKSANFQQFIQLANLIQKAEELTPDVKGQIQVKYAQKLEQCVERLVFETPMETMTRHQDIVNEALAADGVILSTFKDYPGLGVTPKIMRCKEFAGKELSGLVALGKDGEAKWKGKTLKQYIERDPSALKVYDLAASRDDNYKIAIDAINNLFRHEINETEVFGKTHIPAGSDTVVELSLAEINDRISNISDDVQKQYCLKALQDQMKIVFYNASRQDAMVTYNAIISGDFGGKVSNIDEFFKDMAPMTYENVDSDQFSKLANKVTGETKISPQEVGSYLRGKLGKAAYDAFVDHITAPGNLQTMSEDLPLLLKYVQKVGACKFLNPWQKSDLISKVTPYIEKAFDQDTLALVSTFSEKYSQKTYTNYLETGYSKGGMKELFASDKSTSVQEVKRKVEYLEDLSSEYECIRMGGEYKLNSSDEKYIVKTLLTNRDNPNASYVREKNDELRLFMDRIKNSTGGSFGSLTSPQDILATEPYMQLEARLEEIADGRFGEGSYDKYTALILLRGKAVSLFRNCMKQLTSRDGDRRSWLQANFGKVEGMRDVWGINAIINIGGIDYQTGILQRIDEAIAAPEFDGLEEKSSGLAARRELEKYLTPGDAEKVLNSPMQL